MGSYDVMGYIPADVVTREAEVRQETSSPQPLPHLHTAQAGVRTPSEPPLLTTSSQLLVAMAARQRRQADSRCEGGVGSGESFWMTPKYCDVIGRSFGARDQLCERISVMSSATLVTMTTRGC